MAAVRKTTSTSGGTPAPVTNNLALSGEPGPGETCRVCGGRLSATLTCGTCGAAYGEANRCPHCRAVAGTEPSAAFGARCRVCGGPRIAATDATIVRTGREIPLLRRIERSRIAAGAWRAGAWMTGLFGTLSLSIAGAVLAWVRPGGMASAFAIVLAAIPLVVALPAAARARKLRGEREELLSKAWALVAADAVASRNGDISAAELARVLGIDEGRADALLARLSAESLVSARVTQEGDVVYGATPSRVRVETASAPSAGDDAVQSEAEPAHARAEGPK